MEAPSLVDPAVGPVRALSRVVVPFVGLNLVALVGYRILFLVSHVAPERRDDTWQVLLYGARLDAALLGSTLALIALLSLLRLRVSLRVAFTVCLVITVLNLLLCTLLLGNTLVNSLLSILTAGVPVLGICSASRPWRNNSAAPSRPVIIANSAAR